MTLADDLIDHAMAGRWGVMDPPDNAASLRFQNFLERMGDKVTDLAKAAAKDKASTPARSEDGIPRQVPADQLAALIHTFGDDDAKKRWNAGAPGTPAAPHVP